ncbi:MAG: endonuclease I family protein [Verrucomicrobiales bacterium]
MRVTPSSIVSAICACCVTACCAEPPPGYYRQAEGKSGQSLRQALHEIIDDHTVLEYTRTDEAFALTDRDPSNSSRVILIYSRRSEPALCCTGEWNREHVWPNSLGIDRQLPPYSDLHNLRPSDYDVNSERGHKYFDESDAEAPAFAQPAHPESPACSADTDSWEPPESIKGDIARAMFYMAIRYEGGPGEPDLELTDDPSEITTSGSKMGRLTTLLVWHLVDPVSPEERLRNEGVFTHQGNRNPFVDHPEWVTEIWPTPLQLELQHEGAQAEITWPAGIPRSIIESSADLNLWEELQATPLESQGRLSIKVDTAIRGRRYYRLALR